MDSLTQIVLGAACGEAVLGKKIGNKALLIGAVGGTIPDLDVFIGKLIYNNEIDAMLFHRGFMHSIVFAILGCFVFGWITFRLYNSGKRKHTTTQKDWISLFFWSIFTHPILDSFTSYGTELLAPFSNYRVALNTISVVDPFYTIPFLLSLIILMFFKRTSTKRKIWLKIGVIVSSIYLTFTIFNKIYVDNIFEKSFKKKGINYTRYLAQPTIFNNFLWYAIAETTDAYHISFYSNFDKSDFSSDFLKITKSDADLKLNDSQLQKLIWFSNGYYKISKSESENKLIYKDLRYPLLNPKDENSSVFSFNLIKVDRTWDILPYQGVPPKKEDFSKFFERVKGI